jgi:hypothetical protein
MTKPVIMASTRYIILDLDGDQDIIGVVWWKRILPDPAVSIIHGTVRLLGGVPVSGVEVSAGGLFVATTNAIAWFPIVQLDNGCTLKCPQSVMRF